MDGVLDSEKKEAIGKTLRDSMGKEFKNLELAHKKASDSNLALTQAMQSNLENWKLLSLGPDALKEKIPSSSLLSEAQNLKIKEVRLFQKKLVLSVFFFVRRNDSSSPPI